MNVKELFLSPTTNIARDYLLKENAITSFFDYHFQETDVFWKRKKDLATRSYPRHELVDVLTAFQKKFSYHENALVQLNKLKNDNSLVVIGGQQPGVATGPLYTIYKALTVIQLAQKEEKNLGVPVIPLFWIAGEDHDFAEINHLFVKEKKQFKKLELQPSSKKRISLSEQQIAHNQAESWIVDVFRTFSETKQTKPLLEKITRLLHRSKTYVDFFGELMSWLFKDEGLVLLDSGDVHLRQLEKSFFASLINESHEIHDAFLAKAKKLEQLGYGQPIEITNNNANLFYLKEGEREKLVREGDRFIGRSETFSKWELLAIAEEHPERLSNNVVTRPLMQEFLFPVLAFVAGPGEIAYWATLKNVFHHFSFLMPPLVPRLSITIIDQKTNKWMEEKNLSLVDAFSNELHVKRERWLKKVNKWDIDGIAAKVKQQIDDAHKELRLLAADIEKTSEKLANKNLHIITSQIDYLAKKLNDEVENRYEDELTKFTEIGHMLRPLDRPQERIFNILYFMNNYGEDFIVRLKELDLQVDETHKVIFM